MNPKLSFLGGAVVGQNRISSPSAQLLIENEQITLVIPPLDTYHFPVNKIISIKTIGYSKISIQHTVLNYPARIFFISNSARDIVKQINEIDFLCSRKPKYLVYAKRFAIFALILSLIGLWQSIIFHRNLVLYPYETLEKSKWTYELLTTGVFAIIFSAILLPAFIDEIHNIDRRNNYTSKFNSCPCWVKATVFITFVYSFFEGLFCALKSIPLGAGSQEYYYWFIRSGSAGNIGFYAVSALFLYILLLHK